MFALNVVYLIIFQQTLFLGAVSKIAHRIHYREDLEPVEEERDQGLIKDVFLLRILPAQQGVGKVDDIVLEILIMIPYEMVALF
jgi:hypothetical protein